jgi:tRNA G18 (ribose-2'-O)-methylase SpoU
MTDETLYIILDNVKYNNNIGPIFRVADSFNVKKLYLCREGREKFKQKKLEILKKSSRGAINFVDWELHPDAVKLVQDLKAEGVHIISVDIRAKKYINAPTLKIKYPAALVFGTEAIGLNPEIVDISDEIVKIQMNGKIPSLNVCSAVAIATYQIRYS